MYKNEQTTARIDSETAKKLKLIAGLRGLTVSELLNELTEKEYEELSNMTLEEIEKK